MRRRRLAPARPRDIVQLFECVLAPVDREQAALTDTGVIRGREDRDRSLKRVRIRVRHAQLHAEQFIRRGYDLAQHMSWDAVARDYVLPGLQRAAKARRLAQIA